MQHICVVHVHMYVGVHVTMGTQRPEEDIGCCALPRFLQTWSLSELVVWLVPCNSQGTSYIYPQRPFLQVLWLSLTSNVDARVLNSAFMLVFTKQALLSNELLSQKVFLFSFY